MKTHLYALCWNEEEMLGFFFRNYDPWIDRYIIYNDGSTDRSVDILEAHPKVELRDWNRKNPESYLESQVDWLNEAWKQSRGSADWVVMVDIDEHLFVPNKSMGEVLQNYKSGNISQVPAMGFQMLSDDFPKEGEHLVQTRTWGSPTKWMSKMSIFNPDAIKETNFTGGRHFAYPSGYTKYPKQDELLLFHYKYMDFERMFKKQDLHYINLGSMDKNHGKGWGREKRKQDWDKFAKKSMELSWPIYNANTFPNSFRWWRMGTYMYFLRWLARAKRFARNPVKMMQRLKLSISTK